jgi:superfamily II DNA helicase RecQ
MNNQLHPLQLDCQEIAEQMSNLGLKARAYHAGLKPKERHEVQREWMEGTTKVLEHT